MKTRILITFVVLGLLISGCHVTSTGSGPSPKTAAPKILPGIGGITGSVLSSPDGKPVKGMAVHLAGVFRNKNKAAFLFDSANNPSAMTDKNGVFTITSVPSGEYVIILGDQMTGTQIISDENGKAKVWIIQPDQVADAGQIQSNR